MFEAIKYILLRYNSSSVNDPKRLIRVRSKELNCTRREAGTHLNEIVVLSTTQYPGQTCFTL